MNNKRFKEKENPSAKIAFFVWDSHQYYNYKNIAAYLPEAEYVVCDTWHSDIGARGTAHIEEIIGILEKNGCHWRVLTELNDTIFIEKFLEKYDILASTLMMAPLTSISSKEWFFKKKTVRILDGCSKGLATFAPWSSYFDIVFAYGPYTEEYLNLINTTYTIGNHKFDDWFSGAVNQKEIEHIKTKLDPNKKTILYLPTHSGLSSLYDFAGAVDLLGEKYNVLAKLHRHSGLSEKEAYVPLLNGKVFIFGSKDDLLPLLAASDLVISDSSSVSLEVLLVNKPMVILDVADFNKESWRKHQQAEEFNDFWYSGGLEYEESAGKKLRDLFSNFGFVAKSPDEIEKAIEQVCGENWEASNGERQKLKDYIFSYQDGKSGERAAKIIHEFLTAPKPLPPLLGAAMRAYFVNVEKNYKFGIQKMDKVIKLQNQKLSQYFKEAEAYRLIKNEKSLIGKISKVLKQFFHE